MRNLLWLALAASTLTACSRDDGPTGGDPPGGPAADPYADCCARAPLVQTGPDYLVYAPSSFTPDGDGLNDAFAPLADEGVAGIGFEVYDPAGALVYTTEHRHPRSEIAALAWDGTRADGTPYEGAFDFTLDLWLRSGSGIRTAGQGCAVRCASDPDLLARSNCSTAAQWRAGGFDPDAPRGEFTCLSD